MGAEGRLLDPHLTCSVKHSQRPTRAPMEDSLFLAELLKTVSLLWLPLLSHVLLSIFLKWSELGSFRLFYLVYSEWSWWLLQDYTQLRPSQELIAKDLHGVEWRFKHIYRGILWDSFVVVWLDDIIELNLNNLVAGQPRRHLLTTGWSIFVSQKNLISGDAVLFLRYQSSY